MGVPLAALEGSGRAFCTAYRRSCDVVNDRETGDVDVVIKRKGRLLGAERRNLGLSKKPLENADI